MNMHLTADLAQRQDIAVTPDTPVARQEYSGIGLALRNPALFGMTYTLDRPRLPSPHQVAGEMWNTIALQNGSRRVGRWSIMAG